MRLLGTGHHRSASREVGLMQAAGLSFSLTAFAAWLLTALLVVSWAGDTGAMRPSRVAKLRKETVDMFYHGYDNYMNIAFPEDELRPVSCTPRSRDSQNPNHFELNDVLGNYSLTLIDTLSTLAILASAPPEDGDIGRKALADFQNGVSALVEQYGDGTSGPSGQGLRARGFDLNSKVQVFETVIRGVGGLLSAHLFATGDLPISNYRPPKVEDHIHFPPIRWPNGFEYDGQLLRLALDLATRLLPAFYTNTGMPYPRVNLRHGIPFYLNSPLHGAKIEGIGPQEGPAEVTETCSAGAGSLVLEFTVLSRLTGDPRFEQLAKRAFWAVWYRRSDIGLIGAGIDAEQGKWVYPAAHIGAGIDSFFEYALKTHILLSGHGPPNNTHRHGVSTILDWHDPNTLFPPLSEQENSPDSFLQTWHLAHAAIKRHLYNERDHPHYVNANLWTGSMSANWIDSLGAYYSGLLTLAGELDEAIQANLLYAAVWTKYGALPERWSTRDKTIEGGLTWWPLRPEFIESTFHIFQATKDPWYLYVGEMVLRDIIRRCWTRCGFAGLQNVVDGTKADRMESFFLGETAKYMYLLFDEDHPLNSIDSSYVFTTEGHPLIIPQRRNPTKRRNPPNQEHPPNDDLGLYDGLDFTNTCPVPPRAAPLTGSIVAARSDIFHAAKMLDLHLVPNVNKQLETVSDAPAVVAEPQAFHTIFPWTLPPTMLPDNGTCDKVFEPTEMELQFSQTQQDKTSNPQFDNFLFGASLDRLSIDKVRITSTNALKITLRLEQDEDPSREPEWRVIKVNNVPLGRDESIVIDRGLINHISDPKFHLVRDPIMVKLHHLHVIPPAPAQNLSSVDVGTQDVPSSGIHTISLEDLDDILDDDTDDEASDLVPGIATMIKSLFGKIASSLDRPTDTPKPTDAPPQPAGPYNLVINITGVTPTGRGAVPLPAVDTPPGSLIPTSGDVPPSLLPWYTVFSGGTACDEPLPDSAPREHQIIVLRRGGCSFSEKLAHIPAFTPTHYSLQLVIIVSDDADFRRPDAMPPPPSAHLDLNSDYLTRPLLENVQTTPAGLPRTNPIALVMVGGGEEMYQHLAAADQLGITRRFHIESNGHRVGNIIVDDGESEWM